MPKLVPYWLSPPISIIGLLTWPTNTFLDEAARQEPSRQEPLEHAEGGQEQSP
jgi:hypothetical protein